jgi:hypothetical protein
VELDKDIKQHLADLLVAPHKVSLKDTAILKDLLQEYPYYQPLHLLLAKANRHSPEENTTLSKASLYTNGQLLHNFIFKLQDTQPEFNIVTQPAEIIGEMPVTDEQETFEEITEVDLAGYRPFRNSVHPEAGPEVEEQQTEVQEEPSRTSLEDDFVFESIASTDFFAFEENFDIDHIAENQQVTVPATPEATVQPEEKKAGNSQMSNYNDEKLPYTFLWWLAKTRKEYQTIFQPYAVPRKEQEQELQQQYVEHIFHVQSHLTGKEELLENAGQPKPMTKDFEIIENFIRKDPQITPPNAEQIDNENKAKKSAEDQNDLVSETLAGIYIEQMLYEKAIDTYQKLSLKFPEKSRYFADLIQSIEKKI